MYWWLRGWNERSFVGWKRWWMSVGFSAALFLCVESLFLHPATAPHLLDWARLSIFLAFGMVLLARFGQWQTGQSFLASLAGWSRIAWALPMVAVIDGAVEPLWPGLVSGAYWSAPQNAWSWIAIGWNGWGFASLGLVICSGVCAWLAYAQARAMNASNSKRSASVLVIPLLWIVLLVPSLFAWTRLSSYGVTFAANTSVVAQAFERVFDRSVWSVGTERFVGAEALRGASAGKLVPMVLAWIGLFGLLAPSSRRDAKGFDMRERAESLLPFIGAMVGGSIFGAVRVVGQTFLGQLLFWVTLFCLMGVFARWLVTDHESDAVHDTLERETALLGTGALLFGWPALIFAGIAGGCNVLRRQAAVVSPLPAALVSGGLIASLYLFGSAMMQRSYSLAGWNVPLLLGIVGVFGVLELVFSQNGHLGSSEQYLSTKTSKIRMALAWGAAVGLLWWGVGVGMFAVVAVVLFFLLPAILWLFLPTERQLRYGRMVFAFVLGLLLHPGLFLP